VSFIRAINRDQAAWADPSGELRHDGFPGKAIGQLPMPNGERATIMVKAPSILFVSRQEDDLVDIDIRCRITGPKWLESACAFVLCVRFRNGE